MRADALLRIVAGMVRPGAAAGGSISRSGPSGGPARPRAAARVHCVFTVPIGADGA